MITYNPQPLSNEEMFERIPEMVDSVALDYKLSQERKAVRKLVYWSLRHFGFEHDEVMNGLKGIDYKCELGKTYEETACEHVKKFIEKRNF